MHRHYTTRVKPSAILPKCPDVKGLILSDNLPEEKVGVALVVFIYYDHVIMYCGIM